ncbi:MAG TPA: iron-siderophore ABC transporter substrate-binding protein [Burkholderiaceae bacterium]|jgi:iron complex transport system substrate-binding protein|nr:iron-siderophore ABC transporter substrate-binding protein [Burkholderiaceae bacterium]
MSLFTSTAAGERQRRLFSGLLTVLALAGACLLSDPSQAATRNLDTAYGPVQVPNEPQRVITLDEGALDTALAAGIQPVGSVAARGGTDLPTYLQSVAGDIPIVGVTREPNLEAILSQRPDLILAPPGLEKRVYDVLSKIAPTVVSDVSTTAPWAERNALYAAALNKEDDIAARIAVIQARIASLRERIPAGQTYSVVRWMPQGPMAMSEKLIAGQILTALGLKSTDVAASLGERPHSDILSLENLAGVDADWMFIATLNEQGDATLAAAQKQPAFNRLKAVRNDRAFPADGHVWSSATGVLAAERILDDVERILLK